MKIIEIRPVRFTGDNTGLVDVVYYKRHGFLWLKSKKVTRRAMCTTGILWAWVDSPSTYLHELTDTIRGNIPELCDGPVLINDGV